MSRADPLALVEHAAIADEVAMSLRHDLRNHLANIRNASFFLRRKLVLSGTEPRIDQFFQMIDDEVGASDQLLDTGLGARIFSRATEDVDPSAAIDRALALARVDAPGVRVERRGAFEGRVRADPRELTLAVRCLVENALESLVDAAHGDAVPGTLTIDSSRVGDEWVMQMSDTGPGISDPAAALEAFASTREGHVGLGLNMARRVAMRAGGALVVEASRVVIRLPLS